MAQRRKVTAIFKTHVVLDQLTGRKRMAQICREHHLTEQVVMRWRAVFLEWAERLFSAETEPDEPLERLAELERLGGRLTLERDRAKKASQLWGSSATRSGN